jgi:hypothetical protein
MIISKDPDFLSLPPAYANYPLADDTRSFFLLPEWFDLMWRTTRRAKTHVHLYADALPATVALACWTHGKGRLEGLANFYSMAYAPLVMTKGEPGASAIAELIAQISKKGDQWSIVRFSALDPFCATYSGIVEGLSRSGLFVQPFFDNATWFERTEQLTFQDYFDQLPSQLRNTHHRQSRKAMRDGIQFTFTKHAAGLEPLIRDYDTVYRSSWKRSEPYPSFMPELLRLAARKGALRLGFARFQNKPIATQFWIVWNGEAIIYKLAHDERYAGLSVGTLLTMHMMKRVFEEDHPREITFGRGDDPYKRLWLRQRRETWGILGANPHTLRGVCAIARAAAGRIRRRARAHLRPNEPSIEVETVPRRPARG